MFETSICSRARFQGQRGVCKLAPTMAAPTVAAMQCMQRATNERVGLNRRSAAVSDEELNPDLNVIDTLTLEEQSMHPSMFFSAYGKGHVGKQRSGCVEEQPLLKLKDYPPNRHFSDVLPRHSQVQTLKKACLIGLLVRAACQGLDCAPPSM
jgi:hypothetical protein